MIARLSGFLITLFIGVAACCSMAEAPRARSAAPPIMRTAQLVEPDGTPIVGAKVYPAFRSDRQWWTLPAVVSDRKGEVRFSRGDVNFVVIIPSASSGEQKSAPIFASLGMSGSERIMRPNTVNLRARFVDGAGKPIAGREVMVFPSWKGSDPKNEEADLPAESTAFVWAAEFPRVPDELRAALTAQTDATGTAHFAALPQNQRVSLAIDAAPGVHGPLALAGSVLLTPEPEPSVTIRVPMDGVITGRVVMKRTGKPVRGARVMLTEPGFQEGLRPVGPRVDDQGRFRFTGLYPATYNLTFEGAEEEPEGEQYQQEKSVEVTLTEQRTADNERVFLAEQDIALVKAAKVVVTVRDDGGRPVFGQWVTIDHTNGGGGSLTNLEGKVTLYDLPGTGYVTWNRSTSDIRQPITLAEGEHYTVSLGGKPVAGKGALRAQAPDFLGKDAFGKSVRLSQFREKVVVLDFISASKESFDEGALKQAEVVARRLKDTRVRFLAICTSFGEDDQKPGWLARKVVLLQPRFPHIRFLSNVPDGKREPAPAEQYKVQGWPQRFVIGPEGTLRSAYGSSGYGGGDSDYQSINDAARLLRDVQAAGDK